VQAQAAPQAAMAACESHCSVALSKGAVPVTYPQTCTTARSYCGSYDSRSMAGVAVPPSCLKRSGSGLASQLSRGMKSMRSSLQNSMTYVHVHG
jgi:hypothetical protein